jgi:hypothetical protein
MANAVDPRTPAGETPVSTETAKAPTAARRYADKDPLDRQALADALADELYGHAVGPKDIDPGPTVVTIEGPWGSGKSTLMDLVRKQLPDPPRSTASPRRLTVRMASWQLRDGPVEQPPGAETAAPERRRGVVTAWFNPWAHQSGEQVWAGLVAEIIEAAHPVLYPTEAAREHYWFARNLTRVDRYALRRTLHRRTRSPELTVGALGVVASLAIALAGLETTVNIAGARIPTAVIALALSAIFLLLGGVHTAWRYMSGSAARFLPGELFHGPVSSTVALDSESTDPWRAEGLSDPLRRARAGSLYLHQHDVSDLVADLDRAGYELIVFVDDLDRCRAATTAEVFEAINLFLAGFVSERRGTGRENPGDPGGSLRARFVIGLDPVVVARHLDSLHADHSDPDARRASDDLSPGWAFLRKLVHLPVVLPQISDDEMHRFVERVTYAGVSPPPAQSREPAIPRQRLPHTAQHAAQLAPDVRDLFIQRLAAQPDLSVRETMRQLNVLQLYSGVMAAVEPLSDPAEAIARSCRLVILAEIVTRWPAMQRLLHRRAGPRTCLQLLAAAATDDAEWQRAVATTFADRGYASAVSGLRELLRDHEGPAVADLAARLL